MLVQLPTDQKKKQTEKCNIRDTLYTWFLWQGHWYNSVGQHKIPSIRAFPTIQSNTKLTYD